jgi:hypothetical protein
MELRPEYKEELNKCREDINYFLENYMVVMKWGYFFKFEKRGYQDNIFNALCSQNKKIFITKERQIGMSMCAIFFAFWNSILNNNQTIFCCRNVDSVKNLQEKAPDEAVVFVLGALRGASFLFLASWAFLPLSFL